MPDDTLKDEDVVQMICEGNDDAFGILVERYRPKLERYAKRFLFDVEDTKDLLQEVFIRVYRNIRSFDRSRRFSPWIYRIAHNEFVNALKRKDRSPFAFLDPDTIFPFISAPETADRTALDRELRDAIDRHLGVLDAKYREPLILYFFEELDYKEIAEVLKVPVSTVGVRISRGKALLKDALAQEEL